MIAKEKTAIRVFAPIGKRTTPVTINIVSLFNQLLKKVSEREAKVLEMRFGLGKYEKHTLEAIGQEFNITRERVRQIENAAINKLSSIDKSEGLSQILDMAFNTLALHGGVLVKNSLLRNLRDSINSSSESDMNYLELALVMSNDITTVHNTIQFHPYYYISELQANDVTTTAKSVINKLKKKKDVADMTELQELIASEVGIKFEISTLSNICRTSKELKLTENGKVGLFKWAHINPRTIHDKITFVLKKHGKPMHFDDLTMATRNMSFDEKTINVQAVHNELIRDNSFVLIGRGIYALAEWGYKPGTVSDVITDILTKSGPLDRDTIIKKVLEVRQVKKITIQLNLKNKTLFDRVGRNTYDLKK